MPRKPSARGARKPAAPRSRQKTPPALPAEDQLVAVGILRKPHGVRGDASVEPLTDALERFRDLSSVFLVSPDRTEIRPATLVSVRVHPPRALLRFEGIDTPEQIGTLRNWTVEIPESDVRELDEDEYFLHQLGGLEVFDEKEGRLGVVREVVEGGGGFLLVVERAASGATFDLPFAADFIRSVDLGAKRLDVALPAGLIDLEEAELIEESGEPAPVETAEEEPEAEARRGTPALTVDVVTIFPGMFDALAQEGVVARGIKRNILEVKAWDLREFATDKHKSTDDEAYGGGAGMVMLAEPVFRCVEAIRERRGGRPHVVMLSPQGARFDHAKAVELSQKPVLTLLCGRYEGFDERIRTLVDEELSIGDFVVSGGELPAMLVIDAVARLIEGVVGQRNSVEADSFYGGLLDYPHYTRPAEFRGMRVPNVLLSGHAEKIRKWRKEQSLRATLEKRPDLLERIELDAEATKMLREIQNSEFKMQKGE